MKSVIKKIAAALAVVGLVFALSGCSKLEKMKKEQCFWLDSGKTQIELEGCVYKALPYNDYFYTETETPYRITEKDVPVLLSGFMGTYIYVNSNKEIIYYQNAFFAKQEVYDKYNDIIKNGKLTTLAWMITKFDKDGVPCGTYLEPLDKSLQKTVDEAFAACTEYKEDMPSEESEVCSVYYCDDSSFLRTSGFTVFWFKKSDTVLIADKDSIYTVPDQYKDAVKALINEKSVDYYQEDYSKEG